MRGLGRFCDWSKVLFLAGATALWAAPAAQAATPPAAQSALAAFSKANAAVVGVKVGVAEGALSSETLGKERTGSGVVIGPDGLILTIGWLFCSECRHFQPCSTWLWLNQVKAIRMVALPA